MLNIQFSTRPMHSRLKTLFNALLTSLLFSTLVKAQLPDKLKPAFPEGTVFHSNIPYANDTLKKHLLDIYLPAGSTGSLPLVIWVHGGAWNHGDKYADMGYMTNTIQDILKNGYAFASIDYRQSSDAIFPAQIQDCNRAVEFLFSNASKYQIDKNKIALIGFSAGGHLASLLGLSANNAVKQFYHDGKTPSFKIKAVIDFYGPSEFLAFTPPTDAPIKDDAIAKLLGATILERPDLAKFTSPATYVDKGDPPFLIFHGEKDDLVPYTQSLLLGSYLRVAEVSHHITIVANAPHYGEMFDIEPHRIKIKAFLEKHLK